MADPSDGYQQEYRFERDFPANDTLLASAARFLIDGGEEDAASVLLSCALDVWASGDTWYVGDEQHYALHVKLTGPRAAYEVLTDDEHDATVQIRRALEAVLPSDTYIRHFTVHAELAAIDPEWRTELLEIARGRGVHNQAVRDAAKTWRNLRFRSESEIRIAQALEGAGVYFSPTAWRGWEWPTTAGTAKQTSSSATVDDGECLR